MKRSFGTLAVAALIGLAFLAGSETAAQRNPGSAFPGALSVGTVQEIFTMPGGYTARGAIGEPRRYSDKREHLFVPAHFGNLVTVTAHGENAVLWFRDEKHGIRNIPITQATFRSLHLERQESEVREVNH